MSQFSLVGKSNFFPVKNLLYFYWETCHVKSLLRFFNNFLKIHLLLKTNQEDCKSEKVEIFKMYEKVIQKILR